MKIIGHRGARGLAPENTIAGLQKGLQHHVDELEYDLRVTKDNVVVLHHDRQIIDLSGEKYLIADHTYEELKHHKPDLPTFIEALSCVHKKSTAYIEIKPGEPIDPIVKVLKQFIDDKSDSSGLLLGSKSQKALLELHRVFPDIQKIVIESWSGIRATYRARQVGTKRISMNQLWLWSGFIKTVSHGGYKLYAYTLNDPSKAKRWARAGLYGVVTDYPDRFEK